jgi:CheY-like chemotaxis protein
MADPLILVVEDNSTQQRLINLLGDRCGYRPHIVSSCEELLDVLAITSLESFSLVLMDWKLESGQYDGLDCTRLIRQAETGSGRRIPIIGMTAYAMEGDRQKCIDAGMDDYLSKPFTIDQLQNKLDHWLDRNESIVEFKPYVVDKKDIQSG